MKPRRVDQAVAGLPDRTAHPVRFEIYKSKKDKQWRWRAKRNGELVACNGEGLKRLIDLRYSLNRFIGSIVLQDYTIKARPE